MREEIFQILSDSKPHRGQEIADALGVSLKEVQNTVRNLRQDFYRGNLKEYITTGPQGYSLKITGVNVAYESKLRLSMCKGVLLNGIFVFTKCKKLSPSKYEKIKAYFKPSQLKIGSTHGKITLRPGNS